MYWKLALAQHPMYLLIREDSQCAERIPPWGEPTIERYIDRLRQCLVTLRRYPRLKLGFEWSATELELLAQEGPDVFQDMCSYAKAGRVAFYNGTYAQPHAQILGAESNYRQLEYGMQVYREICGSNVHTYCHQETSIHDQMPQLLAAFGIRFATLPWFFSTLAWLDEGELVIRGYGGGGPHFVHGHEFVRWCGLDGTEVLLYLSQPGIGTNVDEWTAKEVMPGLLHDPPIIVQAPDMVNIDDGWMAQHEGTDFVLLDEALTQRMTEAPPRARARFYANWSYIEGIRAEELSRCNWRAESAVLQAEALNALAYAVTGRAAETSTEIWKTILTAQHHDAYCFGSVELRSKAIAWLGNAEKEAADVAAHAAQAITSDINTGDVDGEPLVVFNPSPHKQTLLVTADIAMSHPTPATAGGAPIPCDHLALGDGQTRVRFLAAMDGLGYATYAVRDSDPAPSSEERSSDAMSFENDFYRAVLAPDGTFRSLTVKPAGEELLESTRIGGNRLAAMDSTGLALKYDQSRSRWDWRPPTHGPERELQWAATEPMRVRRSDLGMALSLSGNMGDRVQADLEIMLYHHLQRIDVAWTFRFDTASIGLFYDDETKLRVQWPLAFAGDIYHDIAFGAIRAQSDRPLLPVSWLDVSDGKKGLAYFHQGTPKHWLSGHTLTNLFAWGEDTDAIGNRCKPFLWNKSFDQRLRGSHTICCALYPHGGDWRTANLPAAARSYGTRPLVVASGKHGGRLSPNLNILTFPDKNLAATSVRVEGSHIRCRVYSALGEPASAAADIYGMRASGLRSLVGEPIDHLAPFQIGEFTLER